VRLLDITADLGPGVTPARLEGLVRGVRVAVDVARDADLRGLRRAAENQMRFPTDSELIDVLERLPEGGESGPRFRAQRQLDARRQLRDEVMHGPPEFWFEWFYGRWRQRPGKLESGLRDAGVERLLSAAPVPLLPGAVGLDVLDPVLYQALVSDVVGRLAPEEVGVRELRYTNPFFKRLFGKGTAEKTVSTAAQVIETVGTLGSTRRMARADAEVAERTVDDRVEGSDLDVQLKRLRVEREREALIADQLANARTAGELLAADRLQRALTDVARRRGFLDIADTIEELDGADAIALGELARQRLELGSGLSPATRSRTGRSCCPFTAERATHNTTGPSSHVPSHVGTARTWDQCQLAARAGTLVGADPGWTPVGRRRAATGPFLGCRSAATGYMRLAAAGWLDREAATAVPSRHHQVALY
jgi:hypothetical protein